MDIKQKVFNVSTITMVTTLQGVVNIQSAFETLCIYYPRNPDGSRFVHPTKTREKIPYFGNANSIVCLKYDGSVRGIRQNEGQMNNVVSVDLQCCEKNINLKLAPSNIQLTGSRSEEMGKEAFGVLCSHINGIQEELSHRDNLSEETRMATLAWLQTHLSGLALTKEEFLLQLVNSDEKIDKRLGFFLFSYFDEFDEFEKYWQKVHRIMEIKKICSEPIRIGEARICTSVYNYKIGKEISLIQMTNHLHNKGLNVSFHNWNSTYLNVSIPVFTQNKSSTPESRGSGETFATLSTLYSDDSTYYDEKKKKLKVHRFIIYRGGSIKQTSPTTYEEAEDVRNILFEAMSDFAF